MDFTGMTVPTSSTSIPTSTSTTTSQQAGAIVNAPVLDGIHESFNYREDDAYAAATSAALAGLQSRNFEIGDSWIQAHQFQCQWYPTTTHGFFNELEFTTMPSPEITKLAVDQQIKTGVNEKGKKKSKFESKDGQNCFQQLHMNAITAIKYLKSGADNEKMKETFPFLRNRDAPQLNSLRFKYSEHKAPEDQRTWTIAGGLLFHREVTKKVAGSWRLVVAREHFHHVLCIAHEQVKHAGRDKTFEQLANMGLSTKGLPKVLVAEWLKHCTDARCNKKRTISSDAAETKRQKRDHPSQADRTPTIARARRTNGASSSPDIPNAPLPADPLLSVPADLFPDLPASFDFPDTQGLDTFAAPLDDFLFGDFEDLGYMDVGLNNTIQQPPEFTFDQQPLAVPDQHQLSLAYGQQQQQPLVYGQQYPSVPDWHRSSPSFGQHPPDMFDDETFFPFGLDGPFSSEAQNPVLEDPVLENQDTSGVEGQGSSSSWEQEEHEARLANLEAQILSAVAAENENLVEAEQPEFLATDQESEPSTPVQESELVTMAVDQRAEFLPKPDPALASLSDAEFAEWLNLDMLASD